MSAPSDAIATLATTGFLSHTPPSIVFGLDKIPSSPDYQNYYGIWRTIRDALEGELAIKKGGTRYLRQPSNVSTNDYDSYKARAYWYNATRRTHTGLVGALLRKLPEVKLPVGLNLNLDNVTKDGMSLHELIRDMLSELTLVSRYGLLADIPESTPAGQAPKPFVAKYHAENIYGYRTNVYDSVTKVDRVVLIEHYQRDTDVLYTEHTRYRVLRLDPDPQEPSRLVYSQDVYELIPTTTAGGVTLGTSQPKRINVLIQGRSLDYIPFVFVNPTNLLPQIQDPILLDIVMINLSHYDSTALLEHGRFYAGMPTYYIAGEGNSMQNQLAEGLMSPEPMAVGPSNIWMLEKDDKCGLLEFTGHGLTFLENAVDAKQLQMQSLGGKLISAQRRAAALSSEAYSLMETGDEATLMDIAIQGERAVARILDYMADLQNRPVTELTRSQVEFNKEFVRTDLTAREIRAIQALYQTGGIPLDVFYYTLRQIGVIPIEYSLEDFRALLTTEGQIYEPKGTEKPNPAPTQPTSPPNTGAGNGG